MSRPAAARGGFLRRALRILAISGVGTYLVLGGFLYLAQDTLLFPAASTRVSEEAADWAATSGGGTRLWLDVAPGQRTHAYFLPGEGRLPRPAILYFGGNAEGAHLRVLDMRALRRLGWHVVLVDYRGYGRSDGEASSAALTADALVVHDAIAARPDVDRTRIVAWGRSVGTGVAAHLAGARELAGLVLVSPYTRLTDVGQGHYPWLPVRWLMRHKIDALAPARPGELAVLVLHGDRDEIIPVAHGREVARAWQAELVEFAGRTHDDIELDPRFDPALVAFLERLK